MGAQNSSTQGAAVVCCTTRGDDEARPGDAIVYKNCQAKEERVSVAAVKAPRSAKEKGGARDEFSDGGTGGTGTQRAKDDSVWGSTCDATDMGFIDLSALACVEDRGAETAAGRRALFGDRSLKPKLLRLRTLEAEAEALVVSRAQISKRLPDEAGKPIAVPAVLEAGMSCIPEAELVRRLRLHEESLAGVPEKFVTQACSRVLFPDTDGVHVVGMVERSVELKAMKKSYTEILSTVDALVQEHIAQLHEDLAMLDEEVGEIEDLIALCFDKMDEEATGTISSGRFVAFVCTQESQDLELVEPGKVYVSVEDAESLFIQMSHGKSEITFEQFKDEITAGGLRVLINNIDLRRHMAKRYRDYWF